MGYDDDFDTWELICNDHVSGRGAKLQRAGSVDARATSLTMQRVLGALVEGIGWLLAMAVLALLPVFALACKIHLWSLDISKAEGQQT